MLKCKRCVEHDALSPVTQVLVWVGPLLFPFESGCSEEEAWKLQALGTLEVLFPSFILSFWFFLGGAGFSGDQGREDLFSGYDL